MGISNQEAPTCIPLDYLRDKVYPRLAYRSEACMSAAKVGYKCPQNSCFSQESFTPLQNLVQEMWTVSQINLTQVLVWAPNCCVILGQAPQSLQTFFPPHRPAGRTKRDTVSKCSLKRKVLCKRKTPSTPSSCRLICFLPRYKTGLGVDVSKTLYFLLNFKKERRIPVFCRSINTKQFP